MHCIIKIGLVSKYIQDKTAKVTAKLRHHCYKRKDSFFNLYHLQREIRWNYGGGLTESTTRKYFETLGKDTNKIHRRVTLSKVAFSSQKYSWCKCIFALQLWWVLKHLESQKYNDSRI